MRLHPLIHSSFSVDFWQPISSLKEMDPKRNQSDKGLKRYAFLKIQPFPATSYLLCISNKFNYRFFFILICLCRYSWCTCIDIFVWLPRWQFSCVSSWLSRRTWLPVPRRWRKKLSLARAISGGGTTFCISIIWTSELATAWAGYGTWPMTCNFSSCRPFSSMLSRWVNHIVIVFFRDERYEIGWLDLN